MIKRILLVEDEPNIIEAIRFILSRDGWHVTTHSDGTTALEAIGRTGPDVLVLDVMLPGRSGFDILRDLRADPATSDLPVLMLTAKGQARDREQAERYGVTRFMTKPFANSDVLAAVNAMHAAPGRDAATEEGSGAAADERAEGRAVLRSPVGREG
ncbi:response regulator [Rhodovulum sp. 12E13]|uniref:response regulator transcription factor n=1 Tax=Rhodovulum sp. 12E13 TaxID=2203891 RepID=UPI000E142F6F|nr:response regulator [Rhodovulum sp. 12E13]RDC71971.1 response regulator [Rhodovulum sp. 12E13]